MVAFLLRAFSPPRPRPRCAEALHRPGRQGVDGVREAPHCVSLLRPPGRSCPPALPPSVSPADLGPRHGPSGRCGLLGLWDPWFWQERVRLPDVPRSPGAGPGSMAPWGPFVLYMPILCACGVGHPQCDNHRGLQTRQCPGGRTAWMENGSRAVPQDPK